MQRTPAFAHALILSALALADDEGEADDGVEEAGKVMARGGFTDVGRHTGSEPRDTCWPLVREVLKVRGGRRDHSLFICVLAPSHR